MIIIVHFNAVNNVTTEILDEWFNCECKKITTQNKWRNKSKHKHMASVIN